jgi:hydrogenase maturation protease
MSAPSEAVIDTALLVIGYGNTLRQDDSVGPRVAERIKARHLRGVHTLICTQLAPEHAEPVARARTVVFVDAAAGALRQVRLQRIAPGESPQLLAHAAAPATVLALARDVYGRAPEAWWLTIPAVHLGFGTGLSVTAQRGAARAVREIVRLAEAPA